MKKKSIGLVILGCVLLFSLGLILYNTIKKNTLSNTAFEKIIDEKLNNITHPMSGSISASSNPYSYIMRAYGSKEFDDIISYGNRSLKYMLKKFANSTTNGLNEYIMALACSKILKEDIKDWSSGREWYNNYIKKKK